MDLLYGTDPQADAQPGDQCADTDGLASSRVAAFTDPDVPPATARPLPARALRPLSRVGGLFCPF